MSELPELTLFDSNRTCFQCFHVQYRIDSMGVASHCGRYDDPIDSEVHEARFCPEFAYKEEAS